MIPRNSSTSTSLPAAVPPSRRAFILENALWFVGALLVAFFVWMTAVAQGDPIEQWRLGESIPIRIAPDEGLLVTSSSGRSSANVQLRAQRSVRQLIAADDVIVYADLSGLGPGTYTVPLQADVAPDRRATVIGVSPSQITISLELQETRLVPVRAQILNAPPLVVSAGEPAFDVRQVNISGAASLVAEVVEVVIPIDLAEQRETFRDDQRPIPVDAEGDEVDGVTVEPQIVQVVVEIEPNRDVREVRVQPNPVGELPEGYILESFAYEPEVVYVSGPADVLAALSGTLSTAPINLDGRIESFEEQVTIMLPDPDLVIVTGQTITVSVGIDTQTVTEQFDLVPIELIGGNTDDGLTYTLDPERVSVLVTGPEPALLTLDETDVRVTVDVSGLGAGNYTLTPIATIGQGEDANIAVLPAQVVVTIEGDDNAS